MQLQAFALLCSLAAAAFAAAAVRPRHILYWLAGFCLLQLLASPLLPRAGLPVLLRIEPGQFAMLLALAAFLILKAPHRHALAAFIGGAAGGLWASALLGQGWPAAFSLTAAVLFPLGALLAALYRPGFTDAHYQEEALLIVFLTALAVALGPEVVAGWRAAVGLKGQGVESAVVDAPLALLIAGLFIILGGLYASWKHR